MNQEIQVVKAVKEGKFIGYERCNLVLPNQDSCSLSDYIVDEGEYLLSFSIVTDTLRKLMGKTLTIIDASIIDTKQNKSIKDLIKGVYNEELGFVSNLAYDQDIIQKNLPDDYVPKEDDTLDIEEVLNS